MTQHPLGTLANNPNDPGTDSDAPSAEGSVPSASPASIVDTILDLDEFLSGDVRRAEKTARFATRPDLEADIEDLNARLDALTDAQGRPLPTPDASVEDSETAQSVAVQLRDLQRQYAASMRSVRVRQLPEDDWQAFRAKHKSVLDRVGTALGDAPAEVFDDLISRCAIKPEFTKPQVRDFRKKAGHPAFWEIAVAAWQVNASSGVDIPKSSLSSVVLRQS
jgi:hypothetical protein